MVGVINTEIFVLDASYVLSELIPDEQNHEVNAFFVTYENGGIELIAPTLLPFEIVNALVVANRKKRINNAQTLLYLERFEKLHIQLIAPDVQNIARISALYNITCYDASYLCLSEEYNSPLLTLDKQLLALSKKRK